MLPLSFQEFYYLKAKRTGRFKKGGIPDTMSAARGLLEDWNMYYSLLSHSEHLIYISLVFSGKIKYYTVPPEIDESSAHISSTIISEEAKEFNIDEFESMETEILNDIEKTSGIIKNSFAIESAGPVELVEEMEQDQQEDELVIK